MTKEELKDRTKKFAIRVFKFLNTVEKSESSQVLIRQLLRSASSVAANYRAACRAKSKADFINKLKIVEEELDESMFFLELLIEFNPDHKSTIVNLWKEANELLSIIVASILTLRRAIEGNRNS